MQCHSINSSGVNGIIAFYDHSTELARIQSNSLGSSQADLRFSTHDGSSSAERMRITSGGNVLIAKTSTGFSNVGFEVDSGGRVGVKTNGSEAMYINRSQDGTLIEFASCKISQKELIEIIESKDRTKAGFSVPAFGLYLVNVEYPKNIFHE